MNTFGKIRATIRPVGPTDLTTYTWRFCVEEGDVQTLKAHVILTERHDWTRSMGLFATKMRSKSAIKTTSTHVGAAYRNTKSP